MSGPLGSVAKCNSRRSDATSRCSCGSGRKYKKCCVDRQARVAAARVSELDVAAIVARAIEEDDWDAVHEVFDHGFVLFEPGAPLEHVRFRSDLISANVPDRAELPRLCGGGWLLACEREIGYVLDRVELDERERDGLRLAVYMLRRFGARSPLVEAVAELQAAERGIRARKFGDTLSRLGLAVDHLRTGWGEVSAWIEREHPAVLPFADWFALSTAEEDQREAVWWSGISSRTCDVSLSRLEQPELPDARCYGARLMMANAAA